MKPVEKLERDRDRQAKAVERALAKTSLIKEDVESAFPTMQAKASYGEPCWLCIHANSMQLIQTSLLKLFASLLKLNSQTAVQPQTNA